MTAQTRPIKPLATPRYPGYNPTERTVKAWRLSAREPFCLSSFAHGPGGNPHPPGFFYSRSVSVVKVTQCRTKKKTSVGELRHAPYNPRKIDAEYLINLHASMREFGDLSGIVRNVRTGNLVGGHQRVKAFDPAWPIQLAPAKDSVGTVALGHVETPYGRWSFAMELDPRYCDQIVSWWEKFTGKKSHKEALRDRAAA